MAYLSLYRKYRSQSFDELSGQDHVTRTLQNAIRNNRVAHAYLLCGPRGTGKTSTARLLAKAVNCERGPTPEPCNVCDACVQITAGSFLDLREIDAASNRGIDDIRDLRDNVAFTPAQGRFKVYIIDEAHQLTLDAFNALLKTLEEPPPHVLFVLATTEASKVPTTVASRCQKFDFRRASLEQLRERIAYVAEQEGAEVEPAALDLIARDANGGWRDALSLLEQVLAFSEGAVTAKDVYAVLGTVEAETLHQLAAAILEGRGGDVMGLLDSLINDGKDPRQLIRDLTGYYRELLLAAVGCRTPGEPSQAAATEKQARGYGHKRLLGALEVLAQTEREARWSEQPRLLLELAVVRLMHPREAAATAPAAVPEPGGRRPARTTFGETPLPAAPASNGRKPGGGFGSEALPKPPLTVGDARTGNDGDDEDFTEAFGLPPAAGASPSPSTAADLGQLRARWRLVGEELKRDKKATIQACMVDTLPERLERDVLVIRFSTRTMAEMFTARGKAFSDPLSAAILRVTGFQIRVRAEFGEGTAMSCAPKAFPEQGRTSELGADGKQIIRDITDVFGSEIIDTE